MSIVPGTLPFRIGTGYGTGLRAVRTRKQSVGESIGRLDSSGEAIEIGHRRLAIPDLDADQRVVVALGSLPATGVWYSPDTGPAKCWPAASVSSAQPPW